MKRFIKAAIFLLLAVTLLPLVAQSASFSAMSDAGGSELKELVLQAETCPYDGTYQGTFNYEYQEWQLVSKDELGTEKWGLSDPVKASLTLTVSLQDSGGPDLDRWIMWITHIKVDDPAFETGVDGIDLTIGNAGAQLPLKSGSSSSQLMSQLMPYGITINFPNGATLGTYFPDMAVDDLKVGFGAWTLSGSRWGIGFAVPQKGHPFSGERSSGSNNYRDRFEVTFGDWSLKKILSRGSVPIVDNDSFYPMIDPSVVSGNIAKKQQEIGSDRMGLGDDIKAINAKLSKFQAAHLSPLEQQVLDFQREQDLLNKEKEFYDRLFSMLTLGMLSDKNKTIAGIPKLFGQDIPEILEKLKSEEGLKSLDDADYKKIIIAGISVAGAVYFVGTTAGIFTTAWIGAVIVGGTETAAFIDIISAYKEWEDAESSMYPKTIEGYQRSLQHQIDKNQATIEHLDHQEQRLLELGQYLQK